MTNTIKYPIRRFLLMLLCFSMVTPPGYAKERSSTAVPPPGESISFSEPFEPTLLLGLQLNSANPFKMDFIVHPGALSRESADFQVEAERGIQYFLTSLAIPEDRLWVNLSPYEQDRILPVPLDQTRMGQDLLTLDYSLKLMSASAMNPDQVLGKKFWDRVYTRMIDLYGHADMPVDMSHKVWITPDAATLVETDNGVYIVDSRLKVLLEEDYLALTKRRKEENLSTDKDSPEDLQSTVIREIVIPELEREVNENERFARLRQIYHSILLSVWFKNNLQDHLLSHVYADQTKTQGLHEAEAGIVEDVYSQYVAIFNEGVFDFIKEEYDPVSQDVLPRKYFSGGITAEGVDQAMVVAGQTESSRRRLEESDLVSVNLRGMRQGKALDLTGVLDPRITAEEGVLEDHAMLGDAWIDMDRDVIQSAREEQKSLLARIMANGTDSPEAQKLEDAYAQYLKDYLFRWFAGYSVDERVIINQEIQDDVDWLKKENPEVYWPAIAAVVFLKDGLKNWEHKYDGRLEFFYEHNPLFDDKALEYFMMDQQLGYDSEMKKKLNAYLKNRFGYKTIHMNPSIFHTVIVDPNGRSSSGLIRTLDKSDPEILSVYFSNLASSQKYLDYSDVIEMLNAAAYAIDQDLPLAREYIFGIIPILRASRLAISDANFVEIQISHILNARNINKYRYAALKLIESVPIQRRRGNKNPLREVLKDIDNKHGEKGNRKLDIFRYLRVIYHKNPSSEFYRLLDEFFLSMLDGKTETYFRDLMDKEGVDLFLNPDQLAKFQLWETQMKALWEGGRERYSVKTLRQLLDLDRDSLESLLEGLALENQENADDWSDLLHIWLSARSTYTRITEADDVISDPMSVVNDAQEKRLAFWDGLSPRDEEIVIWADYFDRKHIGETNKGYEGYQGIDVQYKEERYNRYVEEEHLGALALDALNTELKALSRLAVEPNEDVLFRMTKVFRATLVELKLRGLLSPDERRMFEMLGANLSFRQLENVLEYFDTVLNGFYDEFNGLFRGSAALVRENSHIQRRYHRDFQSSRDSDNFDKNLVEERLVGELVAEELAFGLARTALSQFTTVVQQMRLASESSLNVAEDGVDSTKTLPGKKLTRPGETGALLESDVQALPFTGAMEMLPHLFGSKFSNLQVLLKEGLPVPLGGALSALNAEAAMADPRAIEQAVTQIIRNIEQNTGKTFVGMPGAKAEVPEDVLLLSVRSGSTFSMPGILNTVLDVGLNDSLVETLIEQGKDPFFVLDTYRRSLNYYAEAVLQIRDSLFVDVIDEMKIEAGDDVVSIAQFSTDQMRLLVNEYKKIILRVNANMQRLKVALEDGSSAESLVEILKTLNQDVALDNIFLSEQLTEIIDQELFDNEALMAILKKDVNLRWMDRVYSENLASQSEEGITFNPNYSDLLMNTVMAIYRSWDFPAAKKYRSTMGISDNWGTAVGIQEMVFGNENKNSGTAVVFTANPHTGVREIFGTYKPGGQGEDVVSGRSLNVTFIQDIMAENPELRKQVEDIVQKLWGIFGKPQDVELTINNGRVYILQTRNMQIVESQSYIETANAQEPFATGDGQTGRAAYARLLGMDADLQSTKDKIKNLRAAMDKAGENDVGIVLLSYYLTPEESVLLLEEGVSGVVATVKGGSAHATLIGRKNRKLVISGVNGMVQGPDGFVMNGHAVVEGMEGQVYTLDSNNRSVTPFGGQIYEGRLPITSRDVESAPGDKAMVTSADTETKAGIDLNTGLMRLNIRQSREKGFNSDAFRLPDGRIPVDYYFEGLVPIITHMTPFSSTIPVSVQ